MTVQPWGKTIEPDTSVPVKYTSWHFPPTNHRGFLLLDENGAPIPQHKPRVFRPYRVRMAPKEPERFMDSAEWMVFGVVVFLMILLGYIVVDWWVLR